jgi:hypothetical protein
MIIINFKFLKNTIMSSGENLVIFLRKYKDNCIFSKAGD